jgi:hypothetical protein
MISLMNSSGSILIGVRKGISSSKSRFRPSRFDCLAERLICIWVEGTHVHGNSQSGAGTEWLTR